MEKYLPIGSVVLLQRADFPLMVYGHKRIHEASGQEFDYIGCPYPQGYIDDDLIIFFNRLDIQQTLFTGYESEADQLFQEEFLGVKQHSAFE